MSWVIKTDEDGPLEGVFSDNYDLANFSDQGHGACKNWSQIGCCLYYDASSFLQDAYILILEKWFVILAFLELLEWIGFTNVQN